MLGRTLIIFCAAVLFISCEEQIDYYNLATFSGNNKLNAVIEIPAGTNKKFEYNKETKSFEIDKKNGKDRVITFLPYLGNYGFIPSTFSDPKTGGDGDALDVLILSESVKTGTVMETIPIAMLKLIDDGEIDYKIIAIPSLKEDQIINADTYKTFVTDFPEIKTMIETWFLNYNKSDETQIEGWGNEKEAMEEINKNKSH
ncbi:inorganic diphosphatase [uncultured Psychroserpens sp.]|uniref:inorganic diphosphatase n=1 Tax=uncultured Psychroserpens sp. TaxID=255436 RepID=UPI0026175D63|nr:inorganic diphosphatase [uncultured Psychroserpens sp.]